jgi:long-chain acyl-CoA synthetase
MTLAYEDVTHPDRDTIANDVTDTDTVAKTFWRGVSSHGDKVLMRQKAFGIWQSYSWKKVGAIVEEIAAGLVELGLEPGEVVSVLANTCREWVWTDLAGLTAGGVVNGIYPTDSAEQLQYLCADSNSKYLFVEDDEQLDKYLEERDRLPQIRKVIVFDMEGLSKLNDPSVIGLDRLRDMGHARLAATPDILKTRLAQRTRDDLAILVYTSGTTGRPKGAMISHANILASCKASEDYWPGSTTGSKMCFLPLCHVAERLAGEYQTIAGGGVMNFVEDPQTIFENLREIQPEILFAVPRVWEKLFSIVTIAIKEATSFEQWAYAKAIATGYAMARCKEKQVAAPLATRLAFWFARRLVLDNVRKTIGIDKVRLAATGAAPISPDLIRWYMALGIEMCEVWGMTETTGAATANVPGKTKPGSIGTATPAADVRISSEGEILVRGPQVFMGYLNLPEKTAETFVDGWLKTGDVGRVDDAGNFYITDRMKDIIITAGGKNITPSEWENQIKFSPYVTDAVVIGDKRPYLTCLVMIDQENVEHWAQERSLPFSDYKSLARNADVTELIGQEIAKVNKQFARVEQIKEFRLIETQLTAEDEELTPTMKLKRTLVNQKYADLIQSMYRA